MANSTICKELNVNGCNQLYFMDNIHQWNGILVKAIFISEHLVKRYFFQKDSKN